MFTFYFAWEIIIYALHGYLVSLKVLGTEQWEINIEVNCSMNNAFFPASITAKTQKERLNGSKKQKVCAFKAALAKRKAFLALGPFLRDENKCPCPCLSRKGMKSEILKIPCSFLPNSQTHHMRSGRSWFTKIIFKKGKLVIEVGCPPVRFSGLKI